MALYYLFLLSFLSFISTQVYGFSKTLVEISKIGLSEDGRLTFAELSEKYGHPVTKHEIETEDGYLLTVYRQPGDVKKPVLLIHGNTPTGDCWVLRGNDSLSITMANLRYDVWVLNLRGTRYSRKHTTLDPDTDSKKFFNYSFYEQAVRDVPAVIDYILQETGQDQLIAIGHSVGTMLLYVLGSEKPEYNDKIKLGVSLAPISFLQYIRGYSFFVSPLLVPVTEFLENVNVEEVTSYHGTGSLARLVCLRPGGYDLCIKLGFLPSLGYDKDGFERGFEKTLFGHFPGGSTRKIFEHLSQIETKNKFGRYDYGEELNLIEYGTAEVPLFNLSLVTMKSAIFVGKEDYLATIPDAERLNTSLPNVVHYEVLPYEKFSHADFIWGRRMPELLYPYLFDVINKYS